jgi:hypothetical protein
MTPYYFDVRDGAGIVIDHEGFELSDLLAVQREAILSLSDQSRDAAEKAIGSLTELSVEVGPVMRVSYKFDLLRTN